MRIKLGTGRNSLAKAQADASIIMLREDHPLAELELYFVSAGSVSNGSPLIPDIHFKGMYVPELQQALLDGEIDIAVHGVKDLPNGIAPGTVIAAILPRSDPRDALVTSDQRDLPQLMPGATIGVDTVCRRVQLKALRSDLKIVEIHGGTEERLKKLQTGECDGVIVAVSALVRLNMLHRAAQMFKITDIVPSAGQGAIALQVRDDDPIAYTLASAISHEPSRLAVLAECSFLEATSAESNLPVGSYAKVNEDELSLVGIVATLDGKSFHRNSLVGDPANAIELGHRLADMLLAA
jgi:hydroxymethylbilane synthase